MFIGHLPAGYLAAKSLQAVGASKAVFIGILVGSIAPDFDMLWFYLVDQGSTHHHDYVTHKPIVWAGILALGLGFRKALLMGIGLGGLFHLVLDSIAGKVTWGWPFFDAETTLVVVEATHDHWVKSFLSHWTFKVELFVVAVAIIVFVRSDFRGKSR